LRIAVVGAGINGVMSAWALAEAGHAVVLFERGEPMSETSRASTKLLHGGLRYLEHGSFALVREGLRERAWWLQAAPHLAHRIEIVLPLYRGAPRGRLAIKAGLIGYDLLAGAKRLGWHRWLAADELVRRLPSLRPDGLLGGYAFFDGQMDDHALGLWALEQARARGVELRSHARVTQVDVEGGLRCGAEPEGFDFVVNAAGPWAGALLAASGIASQHRLDLVRGSHLLLNRTIEFGLLLQSPDDGRVGFVLPYQGRTLIGTTEVRQTLDEPIACSDAERDYLLRMLNAAFSPGIGPADVADRFAGVRPLVGGNAAPASAISREYALERHGRLLTVFGGKWTTARALGRKVAAVVRSASRHER
jgi:glycerol-3-phosphate dehydrogenase